MEPAAGAPAVRVEGPWARVYARSPELVARNILEERLLVPIRGRLADLQCLYSLGGVGPFVWDRLDGQRSLGGLLAELAERYEAPEELLAADLLEFVGALEEAGLVTRSA